MSSYRQALKAARNEHIRKLIDSNQTNQRFLFSTVASVRVLVLRSSVIRGFVTEP